MSDLDFIVGAPEISSGKVTFIHAYKGDSLSRHQEAELDPEQASALHYQLFGAVASTAQPCGCARFYLKLSNGEAEKEIVVNRSTVMMDGEIIGFTHPDLWDYLKELVKDKEVISVNPAEELFKHANSNGQQ